MALTFPLSLAAFLADLAWVDFSFDLMESSQTLSLGSGEVLRADRGARLWHGRVGIRPYRAAAAEAVLARVRALQDARGSFLATPRHLPFPGLGNATIFDQQNGRELRLAGLPSTQVLPQGTFLSFQYGTDPVRYALHQMVEPATATAGTTGFFEVTPAIRPTVDDGTAVVLAAPICKAMLVPGGVSAGANRVGVTSGVTFDWVQTLR